MKMNIYTVKDVVIGSYQGPLTVLQNEDIAKRNFKLLLQDSNVAKDLQLFCLGTLDTDTGVINSKVDFVMGGSENA